MIDSPIAMPPATGFEVHGARGRFNAAFFSVMGPYLEWNLRRHKRRVFAELPQRGRRARLRGGRQPPLPARRGHARRHRTQPAHAPRLRAAAERSGVHLDLRDRVAEHTGLPDHSVDSVISSLVLCSVADPAAVLAEVRRILRPGGTLRFVEHVAAPAGTPTRALQRALRRPWAWTFEGCSCERDLERLIRAAGFASVDIERYRLHTPFVPFNTHIAGTAHA